MLKKHVFEDIQVTFETEKLVFNAAADTNPLVSNILKIITFKNEINLIIRKNYN